MTEQHTNEPVKKDFKECSVEITMKVRQVQGGKRRDFDATFDTNDLLTNIKGDMYPGEIAAMQHLVEQAREVSKRFTNLHIE